MSFFFAIQKTSQIKRARFMQFLSVKEMYFFDIYLAFSESYWLSGRSSYKKLPRSQLFGLLLLLSYRVNILLNVPMEPTWKTKKKLL